jgi:hypothetical protein
MFPVNPRMIAVHTQKTTTRTVRELVQIQKGGDNRRSDKIDTIEDFVEDIAGNLVALLTAACYCAFLCGSYWRRSSELLAELKGSPSSSKAGALTTIKGFHVYKEDIKGEFDFEVSQEAQSPWTKSRRFRPLVSAYEMAMKSGMLPGGPVQDLVCQ